MKNRLLVALLAMLVLTSISTEAFAKITATFKNNTGHKIYVAMHYKHTSGDWMTQGWWSVESNSSRDIVVASDNTIVYLYAKNDQAELYWYGEDSNKDDIDLYVVNDSFKALGTNKPSGKNPSREKFIYVEFEGDAFTYEFDR